MSKKILIKNLTEYIKQSFENNEIYTFRGLITFLNKRGMNLEYFEAQELGLLDFNNVLFGIIEEKPKNEN